MDRLAQKLKLSSTSDRHHPPSSLLLPPYFLYLCLVTLVHVGLWHFCSSYAYAGCVHGWIRQVHKNHRPHTSHLLPPPTPLPAACLCLMLETGFDRQGHVLNSPGMPRLALPLQGRCSLSRSPAASLVCLCPFDFSFVFRFCAGE
jgi:hypothetical protein